MKKKLTGYERLASAVKHKHRLMVLRALYLGARTFPEIRQQTRLAEPHIRYAVEQLAKAGWVTKSRDTHPVALELDVESFAKLEEFQRTLQISA